MSLTIFLYMYILYRKGVALLGHNRRVHAYGMVTGQSIVHGRVVQPGYLAVNVTTVLPGCNLSPVLAKHFEEGTIVKNSFSIWPMIRLALPSQLNPVTTIY